MILYWKTTIRIRILKELFPFKGLTSDEKYYELKDKGYSLQKKLNGYIKFLRNNKPTSKQVNN